jgi:hypothetical protein
VGCSESLGSDDGSGPIVAASDLGVNGLWGLRLNQGSWIVDGIDERRLGRCPPPPLGVRRIPSDGHHISQQTGRSRPAIPQGNRAAHCCGLRGWIAEGVAGGGGRCRWATHEPGGGGDDRNAGRASDGSGKAAGLSSPGVAEVDEELRVQGQADGLRDSGLAQHVQAHAIAGGHASRGGVVGADACSVADGGRCDAGSREAR